MNLNLRRWALCALLGATLSASATEYTITTLPGTGGGQSLQAFGVNNAGQVVGSINNSAPGSNQQAYIWQAGAFTLLSGPSGALGTSALGIANNGVVVGSYYTALVDDGTGTLVPDTVRGFVLDAGTYSTVEVPGADFTQLRGVSPDGRWVSGYATTAGVNQGFVFDRSTSAFTFLGVAGSQFPLPQGISGSGVVTGSDIFLPPGGGVPPQRPAFLFDLATGTRTDYNFPGWTRAAFRDIDESGQIVGWLSGVDSAGMPLTTGFIGTPTSWQTLAVAGSNNTTLQGNNDAGWIVGNYALGTEFYAFVGVPVPEPSTTLMLAAGVAVMLLLRTQRRST